MKRTRVTETEVELLRPSRAIPLLEAAVELTEELRDRDAWSAVPLDALPRIRALVARIETNMLIVRKLVGSGR